MSSDVTKKGLTGQEPGRNAQMWQQGGGRAARRGRKGHGENIVVPEATFSSYYGRPVVKRPVWEERDIAGYLFAGGLAAGSALLGAGGDLTGRPALRRTGRLTALGALGVSTYALIHDLGRPERFYNMLRVLKPTSPMSVGSWLLAGFGLPAAIAAVAEVPAVVPPFARPLLAAVARPAGVASAMIAPGVATYTAVLIADTTVPTWNAGWPELPFVFAGSASAAASGLALIAVPSSEAGPARRLAVVGAALELSASRRMESRIGLVAEPLHTGKAGAKVRAAKALTVMGAAGALVGARRSRTLAVASGAALLAGSLLTRLGIFEAGVASTEDPKYVVHPQRERLNRRKP